MALSMERHERRVLLVLFTVIIMVEGFVMVNMEAQQQGTSFVANAESAWRTFLK